MSLISQVIRENTFKPEDVTPFESKIFFEGAKRRQHQEQFAVLLFLATIIATMGVIGDSTATVIGAMIISPLMTPIMATAAALVMGQMGRAGLNGKLQRPVKVNLDVIPSTSMTSP